MDWQYYYDCGWEARMEGKPFDPLCCVGYVGYDGWSVGWDEADAYLKNK
jgi:hypothetical protein